MAAYSLARELRRQAPEAELLIVTRDAGDVYAKPLLSNAIASGKEAAELVSASAVQMAEALDLRVLTHTRMLRIDRAAGAIETTAGRFGYDRLVLAVGADPVRLPLGGTAAEEVISINHIADYAALRRRLAEAGEGARVGIIGAGLIGCELADDLLSGGYRVTLIDSGPRPLAALAPIALSDALVVAWRGHRLDLRMRRAVVAAHRSGGALALELDDGGRVEADVVVSAVGLRPSMDLAAAAGLRTARGIVIDTYGRTSDPAIYALGDCAEYAVGAGTVLPFVAPMLTAARAIAKTLSGWPTEIDVKPEPVLVKTPSCKLALLPPPQGTAGEWRHLTAGGRVTARFYDTEGVVRGFGISAPTVQLRQALIAELGMPPP